MILVTGFMVVSLSAVNANGQTPQDTVVVKKAVPAVVAPKAEPAAVKKVEPAVVAPEPKEPVAPMAPEPVIKKKAMKMVDTTSVNKEPKKL